MVDSRFRESHTQHRPSLPSWLCDPVGPDPPRFFRTRPLVDCYRRRSQRSSPATPSSKQTFRRWCATCGMWCRNLISILSSYRHELLPPLPPPLSPQESPTQSTLPALRLFQLRASHSLASGAQRSCTDRSACMQGAPHSRRCSTYTAATVLLLVVGSYGFFTFFRAPAVSSAVTFLSAIEAVTIEFVVVTCSSPSRDSP